LFRLRSNTPVGLHRRAKLHTNGHGVRGALIATPQLRLLSGRQGRLDLDGEWASNPVLKGLRERIEITPAVRGDYITLTFAIASGDKQFRPALVISKDVRGSIEWKAADGQPIRLTVSWVQ
jgi:hypothetical protein